MSKMDDLRAMREARHAEATKRAGKAKAALRLVEPPVAPAEPGDATTPARKRPTKAAASGAASPEVVPDLPGPELCGHRNMGGKTCTRELGHAAKSHRYS